jgi:hypothetical protein|tara:strand:+ start:199 stop:300 length:102 start_codon:yes stop_codon:yes gene_type:complete
MLLDSMDTIGSVVSLVAVDFLKKCGTIFNRLNF